uniref:Uncharacterized protein n=1 Tax=Anguilla anguilla TaxID=7936 RepID=A0A0E9UCQ8_ANGAN
MRGAGPREQGRDWGLHDLQQTWLPTGLPRHVCPVRWATVRRTGFRRRQCQVLWILQIPLRQTGECLHLLLHICTPGLSFELS